MVFKETVWETPSYYAKEVAPVALFEGGLAAAISAVGDLVDMTTGAITANFGGLKTARQVTAGFSSPTCAVVGGGKTGTSSGTYTNIIECGDYATNAAFVDFGSLSAARSALAGFSNAVRGIFDGGLNAGNSNVAEYYTIETKTLGSAFTGLTTAKYGVAGCASPTRALVGGGTTGTYQTVVEYITIATSAASSAYSTLSAGKYSLASCSSAITGLFGGGSGASFYTAIEEFTIATDSCATANFGNLAIGKHTLGATSSKLKALFGGGNTGSLSKTMDCFLFGTKATVSGFSDLSVARSGLSACSNSHGGIE